MWYNRYIGIPFKEHGRTLGEGLDCWGLVRVIYKEHLNIDLPDYSEAYESTQNAEQLTRIIDLEANAAWQNVDANDVRPFDVIILRMRGVPMHVGVVTRRGFMLHCGRDLDVTHEPYTGARWGNRIEGFCRHE